MSSALLMQRGDDYTMLQVPSIRDSPATPEMQTYYDDPVSVFLFFNRKYILVKYCCWNARLRSS